MTRKDRSLYPAVFSYLQQFIVGDSNIHVDISSDYDGQKVLEVLHSMGSLFDSNILHNLVTWAAMLLTWSSRVNLIK